jgi:hypothetical protein
MGRLIEEKELAKDYAKETEKYMENAKNMKK